MVLNCNELEGHRLLSEQRHNVVLSYQALLMNSVHRFECITRTKLFKSVSHCFRNDLEILMIAPFRSAFFPVSLKCAIIVPLLKKNRKRKEKPGSTGKQLQTNSQLQLLSQILEKVIYKHPHKYPSTNNIYDTYQSGFRANRSTETALIRVVSDLNNNSGSNRICILVLLDLIAAFDTVDNNILIQRLHDSFVLDGPLN